MYDSLDILIKTAAEYLQTGVMPSIFLAASFTIMENTGDV